MNGPSIWDSAFNAWMAIISEEKRGDGIGLSSIVNKAFDAYKTRRGYHTANHVHDCLGKALAQRLSPEGTLALLYHDILYIPGFSQNEEGSAQWFKNDAMYLGVSNDKIAEVSGYILATKHKEPPRSPTEALVVDIDMSILAEPYGFFLAYDTDVAVEYGMYPQTLFRAGRRTFLIDLLTKPQIFYSEAFIGSGAEKAAFENIQRVLKERYP